ASKPTPTSKSGLPPARRPCNRSNAIALLPSAHQLARHPARDREILTAQARAFRIGTLGHEHHSRVRRSLAVELKRTSLQSPPSGNHARIALGLRHRLRPCQRLTRRRGAVVSLLELGHSRASPNQAVTPTSETAPSPQAARTASP